MDIFAQQVLDAMLRQNGAVPGATSVPPNFTMPGGAKFNPMQLSNGGIVPPVSGNVPALVQPPGLPAQLAALEAAPEAVNSSPAVDAVKAAVPEAEAAASRGIIGRALGGATRLSLPLAAAAAPMYFDKGSNAIAKETTPGSWANGLQDEEDDLGITSLGKMWGRGAFEAAKGINDNVVSPIYDMVSGLGMSKADRDARAKESKNAGGAGDANTVGEVPLQMPMGNASQAGGGVMPQFVMPGSGNNAEMNNSLDGLLATLAGARPTKTAIPKQLESDIAHYNYLKALDTGGNTVSDTLGRIATADSQSSIQNQLRALQNDTEFAKQTKDWLKEYADTSVSVAKAKNEVSKGDFKIHSSRNGFLIETNDADGNKVLQPISSGIFGEGADGKKPKPFSVMGRKFDKSNPMSHELGLLQNLSDVGILNDVLTENQKELMKSTKGLTDPKQIQEAQVLALARAMHQNPKITASLSEKYLKTMGTKPGGPNWDAAPPAEGATDFLSALDGARQ